MARALLFSGLFAVSLLVHAVEGVDRVSANVAESNLAMSAQAQLTTARHVASLIGGRIARIADTGSMEPQLTGQDLAIFVEVGATTLRRGDIIIYHRDSPLSHLFHVSATGAFICHRIIRIRLDGSVETMGDANEGPDSFHVQRNQILGVVRYAIDRKTGAARELVHGKRRSPSVTGLSRAQDH
jgi:signal peptidase I